MTSTMNSVVTALRVPRVGIGLGVLVLVGLVTVGAIAARGGARRSPNG